MTLPTSEQLHSMFQYEPSTGDLFWKEKHPSPCIPEGERKRWNARYAGKPAITADDGKGYRRGNVQGQMLFAHRIVWAMHKGCWPNSDIDHINGQTKDNRIENLRAVSRSINMRNQKRRRNAHPVAIGMRKSSKNTWSVSIGENGHQRYIGNYACIGQAVKARRRAEHLLGYTHDHGRRV